MTINYVFERLDDAGYYISKEKTENGITEVTICDPRGNESVAMFKGSKVEIWDIEGTECEVYDSYEEFINGFIKFTVEDVQEYFVNCVFDEVFEIYSVPAVSIKAFESIGLMTRDKGVVIKLENGDDFQLTIKKN